MHASSMENMQKCYSRYIQTHFKTGNNLTPLKVLDVGGANVNGSYKDIFSNAEFDYIAADLENKEGVDVVLNNPYHLPFENSSIDVVISGQVFEHVECFWILFEEMVRVLQQNGLIILIAPSAGPIHRYPVDCYRFYPDAYQALAKAFQCHLIDCWHDNKGPWNDLVGVFAKHPDIKKYNYKDNDISIFCSKKNKFEQVVVPQFICNSTCAAEEEKIQGEISYLTILEALHKEIKPNIYLEIGVRKGKSLSLAKCCAHGVDPFPEIKHLPENHIIHRMTSDDFFEFEAATIFQNNKPDLVFIDGMHLFEFVLRDFINIEKIAKKNTVIVIDDIYPNHLRQAQRKRESKVWTGDVWKIFFCLKEFRSDLKLNLLNTKPTGLMLITNLNPKNDILTKKYNPIVRKFSTLDLENYEEILLRTNSTPIGSLGIFNKFSQQNNIRGIVTD
ncbi:hypothetical protein EP47_03545 [Legionella norrlandica]|uniref:Methyltransferase type 11 domain-containing protein n=1 Tax=Legionella norrlandica TaxID=1498499 RepID=A0A0A2T9B8_9GAMM|nr:class I SAM-dependent methyltransferase [Legionella norrlandica]KGP64008.1 hypothetical protein EP47_03545 [Legionella norrlandica]